ncbi:tRNA pseudouridine(38-40) synthase TruA [Alkalibacter saccharofermentans]|uniref:tRNA pseudouridine synthase A n=1 Tax=Alkalibacter saccharofermentans DSM 14828 TaxID=1120975 RepID=A0A1M4YAN3_9FIRM|nr:tRNA pseudouridine(38-40) synthase TruA [Alkalibacter saccharofermentans]SHF02656.1 tRNA pseudouridine38-40 synthase [Alkalibacter saccharofermentans DSM 14828]
MRNIQILIEYDGTDYCGWQKQVNGISVQEKILNSLGKVMRDTQKITGSGRTDAGVHAWEQSANFYTESKIPIDRVPLALNTHLPPDIRVIGAAERPEEFHSRYHAVGKIYEYKVLTGQFPSALNRNRYWHVKDSLDMGEIEKAMAFFKGTHDFTAFSSAKSKVEDKVRTVNRLETEIVGRELIFQIEGDGFLYNMVRIIIGTLIEVGRGKLKAEVIPKILVAKNRSLAGPTAPPQGLYLKKVLY